MKPALPAFLRRPLGREIAIAIAVKLVVITAIYYAFFDGRAVPTDPDTVAERLANPEPQAAH